MFFAAKHHANMKILKWVESAMQSAMIIQYGVSNGTIKTHSYQRMLENVADTAAREIIKEKSILRCEPSIN